mmetsp:Transcript_85540/g.227260  ORF Transcript_85540/g.227260 Transcript_85540/m.227260 type:complete len:220 (-) Transcript_85540:51-710(-)
MAQKRPLEQASDTVVFKVDGKTFEVLREPTLSLHPNCILTQMAEESLGSEPIFVEANGELFPYVLDYLRYRKVHLPHCVSRAAVLSSAERLGLTIKPEEMVQDAIPLAEALSMVKTSRHTARKKVREELGNEKVAMLASLAKDMFLKKVKTGSVAHKVEVTKEDLSASAGEAVVAFLSKRMETSALKDVLDPWAAQYGFEVKVTADFAVSFSCQVPKEK